VIGGMSADAASEAAGASPKSRRSAALTDANPRAVVVLANSVAKWVRTSVDTVNRMGVSSATTASPPKPNTSCSWRRLRNAFSGSAKYRSLATRSSGSSSGAVSRRSFLVRSRTSDSSIPRSMPSCALTRASRICCENCRSNPSPTL
jgi:hypothetical protein